MTASEKETIYTFLEKSASWLKGYKVKLLDEVSFEDDFETIVKTEAPSQNTAAVQINNEPRENELNQEKEINTETTNPDETENIAEKKEQKLAALAQKIEACTNCILHQKRTLTSPGNGVFSPFVLVIGNAPNEIDNTTGSTFEGKSGELLDKMLSAIHLSKKINTYLTNIVKCMPPMNREPMPDEASACSGFLEAQIHTLKPSAILVLGRSAAQNILETSEGINTLREKWFEYNSIPLMVTFHPNDVLKNETLKRPVWEDLKVFRSKLLEINSEYDKSFKDEQLKGI